MLTHTALGAHIGPSDLRGGAHLERLDRRSLVRGGNERSGGGREEWCGVRAEKERERSGLRDARERERSGVRDERARERSGVRDERERERTGVRDEWGGRGGHALGGGRDDRRSMATERGAAVEVRGAGVREREREDGVRGGRGGSGIAGSDSSLLFREAHLAPAIAGSIAGSNSRRDQPPAVGRERVAPAVRAGEGGGPGMRYLEDDDDGDM
jgi:hypothetical protein